MRQYTSECALNNKEAAKCAIINGLIIQKAFRSEKTDDDARLMASKELVRLIAAEAPVEFRLSNDILAKVDYYPLEMPGFVYGLCMRVFIGGADLGRAEDVVVRGDRLYILLPGLTMEFAQKDLGAEFERQCLLFRHSKPLLFGKKGRGKKT